MKNNPKVYLLKIVTSDATYFKIGYTAGSVRNRIKSLQTGCPFEIKIADTFNSKYARKIETSLHNINTYRKLYGEWFMLDLVDMFEFQSMCVKYENIYLDIDKNNQDNANNSYTK